MDYHGRNGDWELPLFERPIIKGGDGNFLLKNGSEF